MNNKLATKILSKLEVLDDIKKDLVELRQGQNELIARVTTLEQGQEELITRVSTLEQGQTELRTTLIVFIEYQEKIITLQQEVNNAIMNFLETTDTPALEAKDERNTWRILQLETNATPTTA